MFPTIMFKLPIHENFEITAILGNEKVNINYNLIRGDYFIFGREKNCVDMAVPSNYVSGSHGYIHSLGGDLAYKDISKNGSIVKARIHHPDKIREWEENCYRRIRPLIMLPKDFEGEKAEFEIGLGKGLDEFVLNIVAKKENLIERPIDIFLE